MRRELVGIAAHMISTGEAPSESGQEVSYDGLLRGKKERLRRDNVDPPLRA